MKTIEAWRGMAKIDKQKESAFIYTIKKESIEDAVQYARQFNWGKDGWNHTRQEWRMLAYYLTGQKRKAMKIAIEIAKTERVEKFRKKRRIRVFEGNRLSLKRAFTQGVSAGDGADYLWYCEEKKRWLRVNQRWHRAPKDYPVQLIAGPYQHSPIGRVRKIGPNKYYAYV